MKSLWQSLASRGVHPCSNTLVPNPMVGSSRFMSKYLSKSATKRLPLTTKRAGKGYYKGKGSTKEGHLNSKNRFVVDHSRRLELIVPDLTGFRLKPYIASTVPKRPPESRQSPIG